MGGCNDADLTSPRQAGRREPPQPQTRSLRNQLTFFTTALIALPTDSLSPFGLCALPAGFFAFRLISDLAILVSFLSVSASSFRVVSRSLAPLLSPSSSA